MNELTPELKKEFQNYSREQLDYALLDACRYGHIKILTYLLTSPDLTAHANANACEDSGLRVACANGCLEVVQYLLTSPDLQVHADIHANNDEGFRMACYNGHVDLVMYLCSSSELNDYASIHACNDYGYRVACQNGHFDIVQYLLTLSDERCIDFDNTQYNLDWAIKYQFDDIIIAMMKNLQNNHFVEYIEYLNKIDAYCDKIYDRIKKIQDLENDVSMSEESLVF